MILAQGSRRGCETLLLSMRLTAVIMVSGGLFGHASTAACPDLLYMGEKVFNPNVPEIRITMNISFVDEFRRPYSILEDCVIDTGLSYSMHLRVTDAELGKFCESDCTEPAHVSVIGGSITLFRPTWHRLRVRVHDESDSQNCWRWMMPNKAFVDVIPPHEELVDRHCILGLLGMEEMGLEASVDDELFPMRKGVKQPSVFRASALFHARLGKAEI